MATITKAEDRINQVESADSNISSSIEKIEYKVGFAPEKSDISAVGDSVCVFSLEGDILTLTFEDAVLGISDLEALITFMEENIQQVVTD